MNRYDKEERIINDFQELRKAQIGMVPLNLKILKLYGCIRNKRKWIKWVDTSAKNELPPDFYNDKLKLMMDVMRIDDHAYVDENGRVINRHNERESKIIEELISKNEMFREIAKNGNLFITPDSGLRGYNDHNYNFYINNFKRVVGKHIKKIEKYKQNHSGFKTIFFIFDESSPYMKLIGCKSIPKPGDLMHGDLHQWWRDSNMLSIIKDSNIDYLIWMTPYKHFNSIEKVKYPLAMIYEVSKIDFDNLIRYEIDELISLEQ